MRKPLNTILMSAATILMMSHALMAGSIWARATERMKNVYADDTARSVGDLLTIKIDEKSAIARETSRNMGKTTSRKANMGGSLNLGDIIGQNVASLSAHVFDFPSLDYASSSESKMDGAVKVDADRSLTDEITVTVEDVLPNGALLVVGRRMRTVVGETQVLQVSGIVRPSDISYDNSVNSSKVADFHIVWKTHSHEDTYVNPGWLTRIGNILNPF